MCEKNRLSKKKKDKEISVVSNIFSSWVISVISAIRLMESLDFNRARVFLGFYFMAHFVFIRRKMRCQNSSIFSIIYKYNMVKS